MNYWLKTSICFLILLFGQSQAALAEEISQPIRMAVGPVIPDEPGPPSCGADGICRVNECRNNPDPDCPELPDSSGNTTSEVEKGAASLTFLYFGDSEYNSLGQETLKLKKTMEGYDYKVLLKHETLPGWADLSEEDEKLADVIAIPTKANLFKYIIQLAKDGYYVDLFIFSHGWPGKFKASKGSHGSTDFVTADDIKDELHPDKTGFAEMPIRMLFTVACYSHSLGETWRSVGAKATTGARLIQWYPNRYGNFIDDWNKGNVSFARAVADSDTDAVRTVVQTYISVVDAPAKKIAGKWKGCPFGKFVLGDDPCAKDYFVSLWGLEWQAGMSGKENMNYSSYMFKGGDKDITKNTKPVWKP